MTDVDRLLAAAAKDHDDGTVRGVAADAIREWGDQVLAHAIEDDESGPALLKAMRETAKATGLPISVNLAWAQFHVISRMMPSGALETNIMPIAPTDEQRENMERMIREWQERSRNRWGEYPQPLWVGPPYQPSVGDWQRQQTHWTTNTNEQG